MGLVYVVAFVVLAIGGFIALLRVSAALQARKANWLTAMRTTIAGARTGLVSITGRVVAGDAFVRGPFAPEGAVFVRVTLERLVSTAPAKGRGADPSLEAQPEWARLVREDFHVPFFVDDGSGPRARVTLDGAKIVSNRTEVVVSRPDEIEPRVIELAQAKRLAMAGSVLRVVVESFVRDDEISIFGEAVVEGASDGAMPYRDDRTRVSIKAPPHRPMYAAHDSLESLARSGRLAAAE